MSSDRPEVDTCDRCDLIAYPLYICAGDRVCSTCVKSDASENLCRACEETMENWTRDDHARA
jgi:hypothetical protein